MSGVRRSPPRSRQPAPDRSAAARIWHHAVGDAALPGPLAELADLHWDGMRVELGRWIGVAGYRALLNRALGEVRVAHPVLAGLTCAGGEGAALRKAVERHGAATVTAGMVALLSAVIAFLGRILGEEMAENLVEQSSVARSPVRARPPPKAVDNG